MNCSNTVWVQNIALMNELHIGVNHPQLLHAKKFEYVQKQFDTGHFKESYSN